MNYFKHILPIPSSSSCLNSSLAAFSFSPIKFRNLEATGGPRGDDMVVHIIGDRLAVAAWTRTVPADNHPEMEFLDINLTKDLSLESMLFTVPSTGGFKKNHTLL
jgi:hypothetical protein